MLIGPETVADAAQSDWVVHTHAGAFGVRRVDDLQRRGVAHVVCTESESTTTLSGRSVGAYAVVVCNVWDVDTLMAAGLSSASVGRPLVELPGA